MLAWRALVPPIVTSEHHSVRWRDHDREKRACAHLVCTWHERQLGHLERAHLVCI
jgi:hypothetical protein